MVLVDKIELLKKAHTINVKEVGYTHHCVDYLDVLEAPAVDAEPIKHGHWIWRGGNLYECSECGAIVVAQDYIPIELHYFCRGCGAKMDEVEP